MKDLSRVQKDHKLPGGAGKYHFKEPRGGHLRPFIIIGKEHPRRQYGRLRICPVCRERFFVYNTKIRNGRYCSYKCAHYKGKKKKWKNNGYVLVYAPNYPFCSITGYVLEHRMVMEQYLRRHLKPEEEVHHINRVRDDNRRENLMLFPNLSKHLRFHRILRQSNLIISSLQFQNKVIFDN